MQRNLLAELPAELLAIIMSGQDTAVNINNLMHTSKELQSKISACLTTPNVLLSIFCKLPPFEMLNFMRMFFAINSSNYQAIKNASVNDNSAIICFALMSADVGSLDGNKIIMAKDALKKLKIQGFDVVDKSLTMMLSIVKDHSKIVNEYYDDIGRIYLNLSGIAFSPSNFKIYDLIRGLEGTVNLETVNLRNSKFSGLSIPKIKFIHSSLDLSDLSLATLDHSDLQGASLVGANLMGAKLNFANLIGVNFDHCVLSKSEGFEFPLVGNLFSPKNLKINNFTAKFNDAMFFSDQELSDPVLMNKVLTRFNTFELSQNDRSILREAILNDIIQRCDNKDVLRAAYDHPYFGQFELGNTLRKTVKDTFGGFFSSSSSINRPVETECQVKLREQMEGLNAHRKTRTQKI